MSLNTGSGPLPFFGRPVEQATYRMRFPVLNADQVQKLQARLADLPLKHGYSQEFVETVWQPALEIRLMPALLAQAQWVEQKGLGGTDDLELRLTEARSQVFQTLEEELGDLGVENHELTASVVGELLRVVKEEDDQVDTARVQAPGYEEKLSKFVKGFFSLPLALMLLLVARVHPGKSPVAWLATFALAWGLSVAFQYLCRQVAYNFHLLAENQRFAKEHALPFERWSLVLLLVFFFVAGVAMAAIGTTLEAQFIVESSRVAPLGAKAVPIPMERALVMAGIFSGLLFVVSLAIAMTDAAKRTIARQNYVRWKNVVKQVAPLRCLLRNLEAQLELERLREAEIFACADAEWTRLLYAVYGIYVRAPANRLTCFLLGGGSGLDDNGAGAPAMPFAAGPNSPNGGPAVPNAPAVLLQPGGTS